ncbi:MAG: superoxide dismutase [Cytophagales bacterium]|nr:MAG: superoxide dismutase [Cytophagales bacterium]
MPFELAPLPYAADALEPYFDKATMEIHHGKHHAAYTTNLNNAIAGTELEGKTIEDILKVVDKFTPAVRNNGGGFYNHNLFWSILRPAKENNAPSGELANDINATFGSFDAFKEEFGKAAMGRFGSGWAWLCVNKGKLEICTTANQDNPLMPGVGCEGQPILGIDVWEHAYYLKYQNRRVEYIAAFWNILNWEQIAKNYSVVK